MAGNEVKLNNSSLLRWYVSDSKMKDLFAWLDKNGKQMIPKPEKYAREIE